LDCTDPVNPVIMTKANSQFGGNTNGYVHDSRIWKDSLYACNIYTGYVTLYAETHQWHPEILYFLSVHSLQIRIRSHIICAFTWDGKYLFTTDETDSPNGKLKVWNIQDKSNITFVTTLASNRNYYSNCSQR
jgi:WD40 repeat protein